MAPPRVKLAVSMSPALLRRVKQAVSSGRTKSVSAYVEHSVGAQLAAEASFDVLLEEGLAASGGPPTRAERARARRILRGAA